MLRNYLTIALRTLTRNRVTTVINLVGLSVGMACCVVVYVMVKHEYTYDNFHTNADRIYRVVTQTQEPSGIDYDGSVCFPMAEALRENFPTVENATQVYARSTGVIKRWNDEGEENRHQAYHLAYADAHFLETFSYPLLAGHRPSLLKTPDEVVLTRVLADRVFGNEYQDRYDELIGQTLEINQRSYRVSGILEDVPDNTNVYFHLLLPMEVFMAENPGWTSNWKSVPYASNAFLTLPEGYNSKQLETALNQIKHNYLDEDLAERRTYYLQALSDIHTEAQYNGTFFATPKPLLLALISMGLIVLVAGGINFINLSTAQAIRRAKEIGIRKTLGSRKRQLVFQFLGETALLCTFAALLAVGLADWFLVAANQYMAPLSRYVPMTFELDTTIVYFLIALGTIITVVAGYYPSRVLASYQPVQALKQSVRAVNVGFKSKFSLRKALVVVQFTIAQFLLLGTIVVATQMDFFREQDMGFAQEGIMVVNLPNRDRTPREQFRQELQNIASVEQVAFCSSTPTSRNKNFNEVYATAFGSAEKYQMEQKIIDPNYVSLFELSVVTGRNLQENDYVPDSVTHQKVLLNETAVKTLGFTNPEEAIGQLIKYNNKQATVVGVLRDFVNNTLKEEIHPTYFYYGDGLREATVKIAGTSVAPTLQTIQKMWESLYTEAFFHYEFMDDYLAILYTLEDTLYRFFRIMAGLALIIGCLGLYGLVSFLALHRQKEISIRKTLGATVQQILYRFVREFTTLVLLAFGVAAPLGYLAMRAWLNTFAYRIDLHLGYFMVTFLAAIAIAWLTVGFRSIRAAVANPVDSLRNE
ncbi:ABC transporter permease [Tunicatimonas pelagia]|uniref:ABC transporter permease n=1 Tax=Tunicatimonas pelagia TaxID=931531 RepID=UPI002666F8CF|nr:ABC transporter permease [Tunicatimonas pelagia]WKN41007.1 ABC transporter permease [Tunicatimonas pelagia]